MHLRIKERQRETKKENSDVTVMAPTTPGTSVNELLPTCCGAQWGVCLNAAVQCGHCQQLSLVDAQLGHVLVSLHVLSSALLDRGTGVKVKDLDGWTVKGGKERGRSRRGQGESQHRGSSVSASTSMIFPKRPPRGLCKTVTFNL